MMRHILSIARKDLKSDFRTKEIINSMVIFSLMIIISFRFAFMFYTSEARDISEPLEIEPFASPILWVTFLFAGMFGLLSSFSKEVDKGTLDVLLLCPMDRSAIYYGKVISNYILIVIVELASLFFFAVFFGFDYNGNIVPILGVVLLGTLCFVVLGTLVSGISVNTRSREVLLPILLIPLLIYTVLMPSIIATSKALEGNIGNAFDELKFLGLFAIIYMAVAYLLFEYIIEE